MNIKLILFDFDGTIADTFSCILKHAGEFAQQENLDIDVNDEQFIQELRNSHLRDLIKRFNISMVKIPSIVKKVRKSMFEELDHIKLVPGIENVFHELSTLGLPLGILTSNSKEFVNKYLERNNLKHYFQLVHSEKNLFGKDKVLSKIVKKGKLNPSEVIYIGDEARDIEASKKVGVISIGVEWGYNSNFALSEHEADYIVDSPDELIMKIKYLIQSENSEKQ